MGWLANMDQKNPLNWIALGVIYGVGMVVNFPIPSLLVAGTLGTGGYFAYQHFTKDKPKEPSKLECIVEENKGEKIFTCGDSKYIIKTNENQYQK